MALGGETPLGVCDYPKVGRPELRRIPSCPSCGDNHPGDVLTQDARSVTAKRHNAAFTCEPCLLMRRPRGTQSRHGGIAGVNAKFWVSPDIPRQPLQSRRSFVPTK